MNISITLAIITIVYAILFSTINHFFGRARLSNGFWFLLLIGLIIATFGVYGMETDNQVIVAIVVLLFSILVVLILFSVFIVIFRSILNGILMLKHEGFSFANSLSLLLGIFLIAFIVLNSWILFSTTNLQGTAEIIIATIFFVFDLMCFYFVILYFNFSFAAFFYSIYHPIRVVHYIIVLGSGLIGGDMVSPLLAGRINTGIKVYARQKKKKKVVPKLILSGGQGRDEACSEASAMKQYALQHGVLEEDIIVENQSINTYQNMTNSKKLIEEREPNINKCRILFCTTNYHVFRSAIIAHKVGLKAQGIGAPTKGYFRYNATLREFVAILQMHWRAYLIRTIIFVRVFK